MKGKIKKPFAKKKYYRDSEGNEYFTWGRFNHLGLCLYRADTLQVVFKRKATLVPMSCVR